MEILRKMERFALNYITLFNLLRTMLDYNERTWEWQRNVEVKI